MKNSTQKTIPYNMSSYSPNLNIFYFYYCYKNNSRIYNIETDEKIERIKFFNKPKESYSEELFTDYNFSPCGKFIFLNKRFNCKVIQLFDSDTWNDLNKIKKNKKINLQELFVLKTLIKTTKTKTYTIHPRYHKINLDSQSQTTLINLIKKIPSIIKYSTNHSNSTITVILNNYKNDHFFLDFEKTKNKPIVKIQLSRNFYQKTKKGKEEEIKRCKEKRIKNLLKPNIMQKKDLTKADLIVGLF